jgi:hypothetical protein
VENGVWLYPEDVPNLHPTNGPALSDEAYAPNLCPKSPNEKEMPQNGCYIQHMALKSHKSQPYIAHKRHFTTFP